MATRPGAYEPETFVEEEPRYLRRQKPVEVRQRRFGRRSLQLSKRVLLGGAVLLIGGGLVREVAQFFLQSPAVLLSNPDQVEVIGSRFVSRTAVLEKFFPDRGRSVVRVPLEVRRQAIEEIPWVEQASVERILPNRIRVELVERRPVAFLRMGTELGLVDATGVILERPPEGQFRFPVVAGVSEALPRRSRERRMKLYVQFMKDIELARPHASDHVSEADVSDARDLRVILTGLPDSGGRGAAASDAVLVHFGDGEYAGKYRLLVENIAQWRAAAGRVESVDLRFARQVVVNPESRASRLDLPRDERVARVRRPSRHR